MFGVILATALTVGVSAPATHIRISFGCHGCYGCYGCHGFVPVVAYHPAPVVYAGCFGGSACFGGCFGGCGGCYGCCGGCYGCYGACYGTFAMVYPAYAGCGGCCAGVVAPHYAPVPPVAEPKMPEKPKDEKPKQDKPKDDKKYDDKKLPAPKPTTDNKVASVEILAPLDVEVTFNGVVVQRKSEKQQFQTPALEPGQPYHYTVKVKKGDQERTKIVAVEAGATVTVDLREHVSTSR